MSYLVILGCFLALCWVINRMEYRSPRDRAIATFIAIVSAPAFAISALCVFLERAS